MLFGDDDINTSGSNYVVYPSSINGITVNNGGTNYTVSATQIKIIGGGGTDVIPLFKQLLEKGFEQVDINNVCLIVVLTDLYLERVPQELEPYNNKGSIQVIWTVLEKEYYESNIPLFGELLVIDN